MTEPPAKNINAEPPLPHGDSRLWPDGAPTCWCVGDGTVSMEIQAVALAEAMGLCPIVKRVKQKRLWRFASPYITIAKRHAFTAQSDPLAPPWPDLVIGCGRPSILPALYIKEESGGRAFCVQLQDPVLLRSRFDIIITPAHDRLTGPNVIVSEGSLHRVSEMVIAKAAAEWAERFAFLPKPRVGVLLGGSNSRYCLGPAQIQAIADQLKALAQQGYGLLVTPSRRTGTDNAARLRSLLAGLPVYFWDETGPNPYFAILGSADAILVTCDSVNMITEACRTGKPVYVLALPYRRGHSSSRDKFAHFRRRLEDSGHIRPFEGGIETWNSTPLDEMSRIAGLVRQAFVQARAGARSAGSGGS